jgi:glutathione S-transferase
MSTPAKLYGVPGSHPVAAVETALRLKDIPYIRIDLPNLIHVPIQRVRFGQGTVPGLQLEGERIVGSRRILHRLDTLAPDPLLYPTDDAERARVEEAETWGDDALQELARRLVTSFILRDTSSIPSFTEGAKLPLPDALTGPLTPGVVLLMRTRYSGADDVVRPLLASLPEHLEHVAELRRAGVIGGESPNAADLQIASSLRLLENLEDLRPLLDSEPYTQTARELFPDYPGRVPAGAVPADWVPARAAETAPA